jgi:glutamine amidotransferase
MTSNSITIVDYGVGNLSSVENMLRKIGANAIVSKSPSDILKAEKILLPGVGHFDHGMQMLEKNGLISSLNTFALDFKRPVLGICLGAQILGNKSDEGVSRGLGWIDMESIRIPKSPSLRVPHMGWNTLHNISDNRLLRNLPIESRFYFVHSFYMKCKINSNCYAKTTHGINFASVVGRDNIYGTQFHPEKSHKHGMKLLKAFLEIC